MSLLSEAIRMIFKRRFTVKHPKEQLERKNFRGKIQWDKNKCIWCGLCEKVCPSEAITVKKDKKEIIIDPFSCIFCGLCAEKCPVQAYSFSEEMPEAAERKKPWLFK